MKEMTKLTDEEKFNELVDKLWNDTCFESSPKVVRAHPCYQEIIEMGEVALPFIFKLIAQEKGDWLFALQLITGENPTRDMPPGNVIKRTALWVEWGKQHGYC